MKSATPYLILNLQLRQCPVSLDLLFLNNLLLEGVRLSDPILGMYMFTDLLLEYLLAELVLVYEITESVQLHEVAGTCQAYTFGGCPSGQSVIYYLVETYHLVLTKYVESQGLGWQSLGFFLCGALLVLI